MSYWCTTKGCECPHATYDGRCTITACTKGPAVRTWVETNIFDEVEEIPNCTVQILRNSVTGEISVGWYRSTEE